MWRDIVWREGQRRSKSLDRLFMAGAIAMVLALTACAPTTEERIQEVRALQNSGQIDASIPLLIELIESGERDGEILYRYGRALSMTGQPGRSVWALDSAMEDPKWLVVAGHQLAQDANRAENYDFALEVLARMRDERADSHDADLTARLLEARVLLNARRFYAEALEQIETILDDFPDEEEAVRMKAVALLGLKETDEAYELIREAGLMAGGGEGGVDGADGSGEGENTEENTDEKDPLALDLDLAPNSREAYWCTVRASFKREAGEPKEALEIVDACLEKYPSSPELMNEAISIYTKLGRFDRVLDTLRGAYEDDPDKNDFRTAYVQHLAAIGRREEAEAVLREALEATKNDPQAPPVKVASRWVELGGFLIERERVSEGLEAFAEAIDLLGDSASPALLFRQAEALILAERYDEALAIADKTTIEVHPPMIRGRVAYERGEYERAIEELDKAALIWPDNAPIRYYMARAHEGLGDFDNAIEDYRQAMRSDSTLAAARERLIRLHLAEGRVRHAHAIHLFVSPRQSSQPSMEMRLLAIEMEARLGNDPDLSIPPNADIALEDLQRRAVAALSRGLRLRAGTEAAQNLLATLGEQVDPGSQGIFMRERIELLLRSPETVDRAVDIARESLAAIPGHRDVLLGLGRALVRQGEKLDEAEKTLGIVLERDPNEVEAIASLGDLTALRGDDEAAIGIYEQAIALAPDHRQSVLGRVAALSRIGQEAAAIDALETYLARHGPYDGEAALELARRLEHAPVTGTEAKDSKARRVELAKRAYRFGAGQDALEYLASVNPHAADEFEKTIAAPSKPAPKASAPAAPEPTRKTEAS